MKKLNLKKFGIRRAPLAALVAVVGVGVFMAGGPAAAATATDNLSVSGSVVNNCLISTTALTFAAYDPIVANLTTPLDSSAGKVTVTCNTGTVATIGLGLGLNNAVAVGTTRAMKSGVNVLMYEIYQETGRTVLWTNEAGGMLVAPAAPSNSSVDFTTFGRVPAGQAAKTGADYADTVVATVNF